MNSIKFTIYEVLGYLAPGIVTLAAMGLILWAAFLPGRSLMIKAPSYSKEEIALAIFAAYALGHLMQGLCNAHPTPEATAAKKNLHVKLLSGARQTLSARCGFPLDEYRIEDVVALAQASMSLTGKTDGFDVFLYREGFYRGSSGAYTLFGAAIVFRMFRGRTMVNYAGSAYALSPSFLVLSAALSFLFAYVFYRRYIRFGAYRLRHLLGAVCLFPQTPEGKLEGPDQDSRPSECGESD